VLDPGQGLDATLDIGIRDGKIAAIQADIPATEAERTVVLTGPNRYVVPGLIDLHAHVAFGSGTRGVSALGLDPDLVGVYAGVTTLVDCGTTGAYNVGILPTHVLPRARTRVVCFLNIARHGLLYIGAGRSDVMDFEDVDRQAIANCVEANPGLVSGIKLRLVGPMVASQGEALVDLAKAVAKEHNLPLMVHVGDVHSESPRAPEVTRHLLNVLEPLDIMTHLCTHHSGGVWEASKQQVMPEVREARARGVVLDPAAGRNNFSYDVARHQADVDLHPDTISTDVSVGGRVAPVHGLLECMAKFMAVGYSLQDVVRMTTSNAARALHMEDSLGSLAVGREADITVLDAVPGRWRYVDSGSSTFSGDYALVPVQTVRAGTLFSPEWGPYPGGWLPEVA
jgi:dihydroorotase